MNPRFQSSICSATGATGIEVVETIQNLWSGYDRILRIELEGTSSNTVIAKHIRMTSVENHPRGWNKDISHQRKLEFAPFDDTAIWKKAKSIGSMNCSPLHPISRRPIPENFLPKRLPGSAGQNPIRGTLWKIVASDKVPNGAETIPVEPKK